jgi:hypothetical protein
MELNKAVKAKLQRIYSIIYIYIYTHIYIHTHIYIYTHTHICHIYMHKELNNQAYKK